MSGNQNFLGQVQQQSLRQSLSTQQIQYVKLLQMNTLELNQYLSELQLENPLVELEPPTHQLREPEAPSAIDLAHWITSRPVSRPDEDPADQGDTPSRELGGHDESRYDLLAYLRSQFDFSLTDFDLSILEQLILSLDENGFLTVTAEQLVERFRFDLALTREAISYLQTLDPPGVGAHDLSECLCIQLQRRGVCDPAAYELARHHLESLAVGHFQKAAREIGSTPEHVRALYDVIRTLNPRPASPFGGESAAYILPDVTIAEQDGVLTCIYNKQYNAQINLNQSYLALAQNDDGARQYVNRKISQAMWVVRAINNRRQTIERIVSIILERQQAFFAQCDGTLQPMRLRDVAEELQVHESTVSRAVCEKYLQCRRGVFPLKYFFTGAVSCSKEGETSVGSRSVKERIRCLIEQEDPCKPLSDSAIAVVLSNGGVALARRTVAKYREELGIPSSALRKRT